jgi:hypothetical protein
VATQTRLKDRVCTEEPTLPPQKRHLISSMSHIYQLGGDSVFADGSTRVDGDELPGYEEQDTGVPPDTDLPPEFNGSFDPPGYVSEATYNVSRAPIEW